MDARGAVFESVSHRPASITRMQLVAAALLQPAAPLPQADLASRRASPVSARADLDAGVTSSARPAGPRRRSPRSPTPAAPDRLFVGVSSEREIDPKLGSARVAVLRPQQRPGRPTSRGRSAYRRRPRPAGWIAPSGRASSTSSTWPSTGAAPGRASPTRASICATASSGALATLPTNERPRGIAWGIRADAGVGTTEVSPSGRARRGGRGAA